MHVSFAQMHKQFIEKKESDNDKNITLKVQVYQGPSTVKGSLSFIDAHCGPDPVCDHYPTPVIEESDGEVFEADYLKERGTPGVCVESGQSKTWTPISYFNLLEWDFGCSQY